MGLVAGVSPQQHPGSFHGLSGPSQTLTQGWHSSALSKQTRSKAGSAAKLQYHPPLASLGGNPTVTGPSAAPMGAGRQQPRGDPVTSSAVAKKETSPLKTFPR